jgi:hypothetical protein
MTTVKSVYSKSENYQLFRSWVALQQISIGSVNERVWKYYDFGPKEATPLVCIPGASGTADVFYRQIVRNFSSNTLFPNFFSRLPHSHLHFEPYSLLSTMLSVNLHALLSLAFSALHSLRSISHPLTYMTDLTVP